ncbi:MAG: HD-GYP domain-containing protein [Methylococcaceae bacterium]|nr:HD-GYP domain-containing protein [Methylococcaceae bacterium]
MKDTTTITLASSNALTKINVEDLQVGMYVSQLDKPWLESNFIYQGFELKNQADINAVKQQCRFVYIDRKKENKSLSFQASTPEFGKESTIASARPPRPLSTFSKEIDRAGYVYKETSSLVKSFMDDMFLGRTISVKMAKKAVSDCVNSVLNAPDALLWMTQLKNRDLYTSQHSMNVCILAITLGRQINLSIDQLNVLGLCGMMHDMGKMRVPLEILNKPGSLGAEELKIMQSHAEMGWRLLQSSKEMSSEAIEVAHSHHERLDGTGYPRKLKGSEISLYTRIVAIVDMYDAITSDRAYQKGRTHIDAISIMTKLCGNHLDADLTYKFIECLGIYPPGSIIEMSNGEIAIVVEANQEKKLKPKIIILLDELKRPRPERLVDLSKIDVDSTGQPYQILKTVRADAFGIDLNKYYHNGVIAKGLASM